MDYFVDNLCITPYFPSACPKPSSLNATNVVCTSADLNWNSNAGVSQSTVEYGPAGFTPGTGAGTVVVSSSPYSLTGRTAGTAYEFYVVDTCVADTSQVAGPRSFTTPTGPITASFNVNYGTPGVSSRTVFLDASPSQGATTYDWDFGDGSTGTGMNTSHIYTANGPYTVCLTVSGSCGIDSICDTVLVEGIGLQAHIIANTLAVYPNPTQGRLQLSFTTDKPGDIEVKILDLSGRLVKALTVEHQAGEFNRELDIANLADGSYMLKIQNSETTVIRRIVKE
ncbi:MAG: PKD domain-containing protein [Owenweeksia sp.]|nr:PKD domain-containing protein [Owenweeksia sp.]